MSINPTGPTGPTGYNDPASGSPGKLRAGLTLMLGPEYISRGYRLLYDGSVYTLWKETDFFRPVQTFPVGTSDLTVIHDFIRLLENGGSLPPHRNVASSLRLVYHRYACEFSDGYSVEVDAYSDTGARFKGRSLAKHQGRADTTVVHVRRLDYGKEER